MDECIHICLSAVLRTRTNAPAGNNTSAGPGSVGTSFYFLSDRVFLSPLLTEKIFVILIDTDYDKCYYSAMKDAIKKHLLG